MERPAGVEPALQAWEARRLPLTYGRIEMVGVEGLEPTAFRLRGGCSYPVELHSRKSPPGQIRTDNHRLKRPLRCRCATEGKIRGRRPLPSEQASAPLQALHSVVKDLREGPTRGRVPVKLWETKESNLPGPEASVLQTAHDSSTCLVSRKIGAVSGSRTRDLLLGKETSYHSTMTALLEPRLRTAPTDQNDPPAVSAWLGLLPFQQPLHGSLPTFFVLSLLFFRHWSPESGSNRRPPVYETGAAAS